MAYSHRVVWFVLEESHFCILSPLLHILLLQLCDHPLREYRLGSGMSCVGAVGRASFPAAGAKRVQAGGRGFKVTGGYERAEVSGCSAEIVSSPPGLDDMEHSRGDYLQATLRISVPFPAL